MAAIVLTPNELFTNLTNLALLIHLLPANTSNKPRDFIDIFMTETIANGNTKIFPASDLPEVFDYSETSSVTTVTKPKVSESYLQISERKVVKTSIPQYVLEMAFTSDSGMNQFTGYILGQMEDARINDLYNVAISDLFKKTLTGQQMQTVQLLTPSATASASDINATDLINEKRITNAIQTIVDNMQVYTKDYNALGYTENVSIDDMVFLYCQPYYNNNIMNLMATLLNSSQITDSYKRPRIITIPKNKIPTDSQNVIGILMHKKAYQMFYKFVATLNFYDASNLFINYFMHYWYGHGFVAHLPMIKFVANTTATA